VEVLAFAFCSICRDAEALIDAVMIESGRPGFALGHANADG
jgi:hypothetical protein